MISLLRCESDCAEFIMLTKCLDADLSDRYGDLQNKYDRLNRIENIPTAIIVLEGETPVGCGCFKRHDDHTAEIKRVFVKPGCRGKGLAGKIMAHLESWAGELGYTRAVLETGVKQLEAIKLYEKIGYEKIGNFGPYIGNENSVCFMKGII